MRGKSTKETYQPHSGVRYSFRPERIPFAARGLLYLRRLARAAHHSHRDRCRYYWLSLMEKQIQLVRRANR